MIELDNGPLALAMVIAIAFIAPILYGIFVDNNDKS